MTETRTITLGETAFAVPPLPLRLCRPAYKLCRKLVGSDIIGRAIDSKGDLDFTDEEWTDLADLAYIGASAADQALGREAFEDLPIRPMQLFDAFFQMRYQTGAWIEIVPGTEDEDGAGEA